MSFLLREDFVMAENCSQNSFFTRLLLSITLSLFPKGHRRMEIAKGIITNNKNALAPRLPGVWRKQHSARQIQTLVDCLALIRFGQTRPAFFFHFIFHVVLLSCDPFFIKCFDFHYQWHSSLITVPGQSANDCKMRGQ